MVLALWQLINVLLHLNVLLLTKNVLEANVFQLTIYAQLMSLVLMDMQNVLMAHAMQNVQLSINNVPLVKLLVPKPLLEFNVLPTSLLVQFLSFVPFQVLCDAVIPHAR
jgi:hypothetical protein